MAPSITTCVEHLDKEGKWVHDKPSSEQFGDFIGTNRDLFAVLGWLGGGFIDAMHTAPRGLPADRADETHEEVWWLVGITGTSWVTLTEFDYALCLLDAEYKAYDKAAKRMGDEPDEHQCHELIRHYARWLNDVHGGRVRLVYWFGG